MASAASRSSSQDESSGQAEFIISHSLSEATRRDIQERGGDGDLPILHGLEGSSTGVFASGDEARRSSDSSVGSGASGRRSSAPDLPPGISEPSVLTTAVFASPSSKKLDYVVRRNMFLCGGFGTRFLGGCLGRGVEVGRRGGIASSVPTYFGNPTFIRTIYWRPKFHPLGRCFYWIFRHAIQQGLHEARRYAVTK